MRGRYRHTIDAKGRVAIPAKMRETLGENFIAAVVMDPCISLYTQSGWDDMMRKLEDLSLTRSRQLLRYLSSNAADVSLDAQGRILLPRHLMEHARLEREALIIGAGIERAEIWSPALFEKTMGDFTDEDVLGDFISLGL